MANRDRAVWLDMFYEEWLYRPLKIHPNQTSALEVALSIFADRNNNVAIFLLLPEGRCKSFKKTVIIFPRYIRIPEPGFEGKGIWEIQKPIYFKGKYQSMDEFIATCPRLDPSPKKPFYAPMLPLNLFLLPSKELADFKRNYIQKVRDALLELEVIKSNQGQHDRMTSERKERDNFIINFYRKSGMPKRVPMKSILDGWTDYLVEKYGDNGPDGSELTERIVRYVLKPYMKKISR